MKLHALALLTLATALGAQTRPVAIRNARILPIDGAPIERGVVVLHNGKITAIGADVQVPPGAEIVDADGGTVMPGLVNAWSHAGLERPQRQEITIPGGRRGRRGGPSTPPPSSNAQNRAAQPVLDSLYARQDVFGELLAAGVTTLAVAPRGNGFPGQGGLVHPQGRTQQELTETADAYVAIRPVPETDAKKLVKETLDKAAKIVEQRRKPATPPAAEKKPEQPAAKEGAGAGDASKEAPKDAPKEPPKETPKETPKEDPKPAEPAKDPAKPAEKPAAETKPKEPPKDPNLEVLADLLEGKRRALIVLHSAADLLHWRDAAGKARFPAAIVAPELPPSADAGALDARADELQGVGKIVLLPARLTTLPWRETLVNPAQELAARGFDVGFLIGDDRDDAEQLFFRLMELVRHGYPADRALAGVTQIPAQALGIAERVGSLAKGKDADLLLFDGDPLDPTSRLRGVWRRGERIERGERAAGATKDVR
jgi:hypothetical protein